MLDICYIDIFYDSFETNESIIHWKIHIKSSDDLDNINLDIFKCD